MQFNRSRALCALVQPSLQQQAPGHYTALLPGGTADEVADQIVLLIDTAFGALAATRLHIRVERLEASQHHLVGQAEASERKT